MRVYLKTERLILREAVEGDIDALYELDSDPEVMRHINGGMPADRDAVREAVEQWADAYRAGSDFGFWIAVEKSTGELVGWFHLRPARDSGNQIELGYRLRRSSWGKGYATEGSRALVAKAFEQLGVSYVFARTLEANRASAQVMRKIGMRFEGEFTEHRFPGGPQPAVRYGIAASDWTSGDKPAGKH